MTFQIGSRRRRLTGSRMSDEATLTAFRWPLVQSLITDLVSQFTVASHLLHDARRQLVSLGLVFLVGVVTLGVAPVTCKAPMHPPDVHSGIPHRAPGAPCSADTATVFAALPPPVGLLTSGRVGMDATIQPTRVEIEPPFHPPR